MRQWGDLNKIIILLINIHQVTNPTKLLEMSHVFYPLSSSL